MAEVYCGSEPCPLFLNSTCVFYTGESLLYIGVQNNDTLETIIVKINQAFQNAGVGYAFTNGLIQPTPFQPVQLGGALIQNTTIGGNFTLSFTGNVQAAKHITTGGSSSQFVKGDGTLDSTAYQPAANYITGLSGDATASGPGVAAMTLSTVNFAPGTFGNGNTIPIVTVNAKGLVTNITPVPVTIPPLPLNFIGDVVGSGFTGSNISLLLQNVNPNPYNTITPLKFTVNGKGLVTSASPITASDIVNILGYYPGTSGTTGTSGTSGTSGTTGTSGTSGTSGSAGTSGTTGTSGTSGTDGSGGTSGTSGTSATAGTSGSSGTSGTTGTSGTSATSGTSGTSGTDGTGGTSGTSGSTGTSGTSGTSGTEGTSGTSGTTGTSGSSGTSGSTGTSGSSGTTGTSGSSGTTGTSGSSGTSGTTGVDGTSGTSGTTGTSGSSGLSGDRFKTTSTTTYTLQAPGNPGTLTVDPGLAYTVAQSIIIAFDANNHNEAEVTSYNSVTGVINFVTFTLTGSGTYSNWFVNIDGASGGDGSSGSSGTSGTSATAGTSGTTGTSGSSGTSGTTGTSGSSGTSGTSATDGTGGTSGTSGSSGTSGTTGTSGTSATSGTSGTSATSGTTGTSGTSGTNGTGGTSGTSGSSATSGTSGTSGATGASGTSGTSGTSVAVSGTTNTVAKFTSATTIGNSQIIDDGTNVGININPPLAPLHLYRASNAFMNIQSGGGDYAYVQLNTPSSGNGYIIKNLTTGNSVLNKSLYLYNSDGPIQFVTDGLIANAMTINTTGSITVNSTSTTSGIFNSTGTASGIQLTNSSGTASSWIIQSDGGAVAGQAALRFYSVTAGVYRMSIDGNGNVGIGVSSPTNYSGFNTLHINGKSGSAGGVLRLTAFDNSSTLNIYTQNGGAFFNATTAGLPFVFLTNDTPRFRINGDGNVGIGVDPSSWASGTEGALQIKNGGVYGYSDYEVGLTANAYFNSGWKYISTQTASMIYNAGSIEFRLAAAGTAGTGITWTTPISIANTGEVSFTSIARSWSYSSPSTDYKNIDWGGGGILYRNTADSYYSSNCYYSTTGWKAKYSGDGIGLIRFIAGNFAWHTYNGSVTAGSVYTLTDKFYISKAGNVGIGEAVDTFPQGDSLLIKNSGVWNVTIGLQNTGTGGRKWNIFSTNDAFGQGGGKLLFYNATGGSNAMVIDGSNNVAINTVTANSTYGTLTVAGTGITIANDGNAKLQIGRYSSGVPNSYIKLGASSNSLRFTNNNDSDDIFTIENGGNVGVGIVTPVTKLDVNGTGLFRGRVTLGTGISSGQTFGQLNVWDATSGSGSSRIADFSNGTDANINFYITQIGATTKYAEIASYSTIPLVFNKTSGGNVGINIYNPAYKLTVQNGDIALGNGNQTSGDFSQAQALHFLNEDTTPLATIKAVRVNWPQGQTDLTFSTYNSGMSEKVRIAYNGAVGVGTTNLTGLTGSCVYIRATSSNVGQTAIAIQDYLARNRWAINGQDAADNFSFNIYSAPSAANDFTRRLRIGQDGVFSFNSTDTTYTYNFIGGSMYIPGGQSGASTAAYTAWNQLVFGDQFSDVARGPNKIVTYGRGGGWVGGIGIHNDTQAYYAGGTHKFYRFDGTTATLNLSLDGSGNLTATGSVTATNFITTSDRRLKTEIKEIKNAISILSKFASYEYVKDGKQDAGFIAQEVKEAISYSVFENNDGILTMSDRPILAYIHKAILELNERIIKLEK